MKITIFFLVFSTCIAVFSIISICTAPIIIDVLKEAHSWNILNCKYQEDLFQNIKDNDNFPNKDIELETQKKKKDECNRKKAMYGLEYSSLILDVLLGFMCSFLGLLHYFDAAKPFEKITGLIGLSTGIIIFVLTFSYICYSGYIFANQVPTYIYDNGFHFYYNYPKILKLDRDGAKKIGNKFICLYYKSYKKDSVYAKYSDLGNRQYNYEKKRHYDNYKYKGCEVNYEVFLDCIDQPYISTSIPSSQSECDYLYLNIKANGFGNKYLFDMWITTIIFSCFISICAIGLAIFGFLLFKNSDGSGI